MNESSKKDNTQVELVEFSVLEEQTYFGTLVRENLIPFDITCSLSKDVFDFGYLGMDPNIGKSAKFIGKPLTKRKKIVVPSNCVGIVVGDDHKRIVLHTEYGFLGWLNPDEYVIIDHIHETVSKLTH